VRVVASELDMGYGGATGSTKAEIVKFHGDFNHPDDMVVSERHYEERLRLRSALDLKLRSDILGRAILFVGHSFRDWNVAYLFALLTMSLVACRARSAASGPISQSQIPQILKDSCFIIVTQECLFLFMQPSGKSACCPCHMSAGFVTCTERGLVAEYARVHRLDPLILILDQALESNQPCLGLDPRSRSTSRLT
jgi:hypothetical protein